MYLRALEIQGFKSFPDKTVLNFGEDITAIVGPNGSGKSNISDAIRWVMGEQNSRQLRGAKMEDVIFGGTEKRSQMGFAQVTLVIDNTRAHLPRLDEAEVAVTRRYYRSGESRNITSTSQSVRLKDVNELFMDTGMGREGYSIIGQGKIDEILSVKSGERREVFEEAAGISKYRHRKEEAERKLAAHAGESGAHQRQDRGAGAAGGAPAQAGGDGEEVSGAAGRAAGAGDQRVAGAAAGPERPRPESCRPTTRPPVRDKQQAQAALEAAVCRRRGTAPSRCGSNDLRGRGAPGPG